MKTSKLSMALYGMNLVLHTRKTVTKTACKFAFKHAVLYGIHRHAKLRVA